MVMLSVAKNKLLIQPFIYGILVCTAVVVSIRRMHCFIICDRQLSYVTEIVLKQNDKCKTKLYNIIIDFIFRRQTFFITYGFYSKCKFMPPS